jgi:hypothetical protein
MSAGSQQEALQVGHACGPGLRGLPRLRCMRKFDATCNPHQSAHRGRLVAKRKSFPAERTYFNNHPRRHPEAGSWLNNSDGELNAECFPSFTGSSPALRGFTTVSVWRNLRRSTQRRRQSLPDRQIHYVPREQLSIEKTRADASRTDGHALLCLSERSVRMDRTDEP